MPLHVPTIQELEALYRVQKNALERWKHVLDVEDTMPDNPPQDAGGVRHAQA